MNRVRLDVAAISVAPPIYFYDSNPKPDLKPRASRTTASRRWWQNIPTGCAHGAPADAGPDAAIIELERVVREYRFKAVELATSIEGAACRPEIPQGPEDHRAARLFRFRAPYQWSGARRHGCLLPA